MKKSAVDILLISMNLIFKSMSHPKQPARAQATVHKTMISLSNHKGLPQNFCIRDYKLFQVKKYEVYYILEKIGRIERLRSIAFEPCMNILFNFCVNLLNTG